jgi:hypothetical protein
MPQGLIEPQEAIGAPKIAQTRRSRISITLAVYSSVFEEDHPCDDVPEKTDSAGLRTPEAALLAKTSREPILKTC